MANCSKLFTFVSVAKAIFATACGLYLGVLAIWGRSPSTDEVFFKAAGLHWVNGEGFIAPEETGFGGWKPGLEDVFASYPPLYPALFGITVVFFGFGWRTVVLFDGAIHVALLLVAAKLAARQTANPKWKAASWLGTVFFLPGGTYGRPDELAMLCGLSALLTWTQESTNGSPIDRRWHPLPAVWLGLCGATSVPCAIVMAFSLAGFVILISEQRVGERLIRVGLTTVAAALLAVMSFGPVQSFHSGALSQNLAASVATTGLGFMRGIEHLLQYKLYKVLALLLMLSVVFMLLVKRHECRKRMSLATGAVLLGLLVPWSGQTRQGDYFWFVIPVLICLVLRYLSTTVLSYRVLTCVMILVLGIPLILSLRGITDLLCRIIAPTEQAFAVQKLVLDKLIPDNARVVADGMHWMLLGDRCRVTDTAGGVSGRVSDFDYVILSAMGSGTVGRPRLISPQFTEAIDQGKMDLIHDSLDRTERRIAGVKLSNSANGAGFLLYKVSHDQQAWLK